jgi:hypothetical protein
MDRRSRVKVSVREKKTSSLSGPVDAPPPPLTCAIAAPDAEDGVLSLG